MLAYCLLANMVENQVFEFFRNLDKNGTGRIGREEFRSVCSNYLEPDTTAAITEDLFRDLDCDANGEISLKDLLQYVRSGDGRENAAPVENAPLSPNQRLLERRRSEARMAWKQLIDGMDEPALKQMMNTSGKKLEEVYHELQTYDSSSPLLVSQFEGALSSLLEDVKQVIADNEKLKHMFTKEKLKHREQLQGLEEEVEAHVAKVEEQVREQARKKFELEKREITEKMTSEMAELETRLKLFQKMYQSLTRASEENQKYELPLQDHDDLCSSILDTKTNLALVQSELARIKTDHETKYRELNNHQEIVMQYIDQNKHVQRQLALFHEVNRNLQDTNDGLLSFIQTSGGRISPFCGSRAGSDTNSTTSEIAPSLAPPSYKKQSPAHCVTNRITPVMNEQNNDTGAQYVIQRLMQDIDSGRSTLRDPLECDGDRKFDQDFCNLSDGESALKSLESDDSKNSTTSRRRLRCQPDFFTSIGSSFDASSDPDRTYKVVLAGDAAVGKSCFIHRFCKGTFANRLGSTLGVDFQIKTIRIDEKYVALQLWDTAGQERFRSMTKAYFRRADGVVLLYDVSSERSFINIREWIYSINETADKNIPVLICGNKVDVREQMMNVGVKCVDTKSGTNLAGDYNAIFYETSSKTGKNIIEALMTLTREMLLREDVEIQTSVLRVSNVEKKSSKCCR